MNHTPGQLEATLASRFNIERELGAGATATVYLAHDLRHDRKVALKVLRPELSAVLGPDRFLNEIRVTARLNHPNIVPLFDSGDADGMLYFVMPAIEGETLRQKLEREKQLTIEEALSIAAAIGDGLAYAHAHNVVHRDIKPENILLHGGVAQIADFGIAAAIERAGRERVTATGISLGTPPYMSPEQAVGESKIGARSDQYALAVVLYEMLAGDPPFTGTNTQGVMARVVHEKPTHVRRIRETISPDLDAAIDRALAKVPADRFSTVGDFVAAIRPRVQTHNAVSAEPAPQSSAGLPLHFLAELNRRRVVRAAVWFAGAAFALLQSTPTILSALHFPASSADRVTSIEVIGLLVTFPIVIVLAWVFEFTEGRLRRERSEPSTGQSRLHWGVSTVALITILFAATALTIRTWGTFRGSSLAAERVVVMPLRADASAKTDAEDDVMLHDAFLPWRGLDVTELVKGAHTDAEQRELAFSANAARFVRGTVTSVGTSQRVDVALYDTRGDSVLADTVVVYAPGADRKAIYQSVAGWLLFRGSGIRDVDVTGNVGTTSYPAAMSFFRGQQALLAWAVDSAIAQFDNALTTDPDFTQAALWKTQAQNWNGVDAAAPELSPAIDRMAAGVPSFSPRDKGLAEALRDLATRNYQSACSRYGTLVAADSQDFAGWYGLGECRMRDKLVVPDRNSASGWSFRSSHEAALKAYRRAYMLLTERKDFRTRTAERVRKFFYTSSSHYREGYASQPKRIIFQARPELKADTLAFTPYPSGDFAAGRAPARSNANALAVEEQRSILNDIANAWASRFPASPHALYALAVAREVQGELRPALETLRKARALAGKDNDQREQLGVEEAILLLRLGAPDGIADLQRARLLADSLLRAHDPSSSLNDVAILAALTGDVERAAQLMSDAAVADTVDGKLIIPKAFTGPSAALLAYAALGGPADRLDDNEHQLDQLLRNRLRTAGSAAVHPALDLTASLAFPHHPLAMSTALANDSVYPLLQAQVAFARGDKASALQVLEHSASVRSGVRAAEVPFEFVYPESALRLALGDTAGATRELDASLGDLMWSEPGALNHLESAASLIRAMILRADIAAAQKQPAIAARWARAVTILWSNADSPLQPAVQRMRTITSKGSR